MVKIFVGLFAETTNDTTPTFWGNFHSVEEAIEFLNENIPHMKHEFAWSKKHQVYMHTSIEEMFIREQDF